ncbi:MAG: DUF2784 domain-containing protein [Nitrospirota bacterium]
MEPSDYAVLADVTLAVHAAFVAFVIGGQAAVLIGWLEGWRWTRGLAFRIAHLAAIGFVVVESWIDIPCSLTVLENALRVRAGAVAYEHGFIRDWLTRLLFYSAPWWVFTLVYTLFGGLVLTTFVVYPPRRRG